MKRLKITLFFLFISSLLFGEIAFPSSVYVVDVETGFKIMLGLPPRFVERKYGIPQERKLQFIYPSGLELWLITYPGFQILYERHNDVMIVSIRITNEKFTTSNGLKIGSSLTDVINIYGNPTDIRKNTQGEVVFIYIHDRFKEINEYGEFTVIQFTFLYDKVTSIMIYIGRWV